MPFSLYRDLVQTILQYFTIRDLHTAVQLSHQWHSALRTSKSFRLTLLRFRVFPELTIPPNSAVAAHIAFVNRWDEPEWSDESIHQRLVLATGSTLPNLERLNCRCVQLQSEFQNNEPIVLPQQLKEYATSLNAEFGARLFPALASLQSTLTSLDLDMRLTLSEGNQANFEALKPLSNLTKLSLSFRIITQVDEPEPDSALTGFVSLVRSLPALQSLALWMWDGKSESHIQSSVIRRIAQHPHQLKLIELDLRRVVIDLPLLESLVHIPTLTRFNAGIRVPNEQYGLLAKLPHLTSLELEDPNGLLPDGLFLAARSCPQLQSISITSHFMRSEHLNHVLSILPRLTELGLIHCSSLESLAALAAHNVPQRLQRLQISFEEGSSHIPASDVQYLLQLRQLNSLSLFHCFDANDKNVVDETKLRESLGLSSEEGEQWL